MPRPVPEPGESYRTPGESAAPVVWITGFSASGKTTVSRKLESMLRRRGMSAVFLDGDELRSILAGKWGYSREERIELARVYFRLCSLLASQGTMVVISAVAMYDEVREWLATHVPGVVEVYLEVPEEERRRRDERASEQVYEQIGSVRSMYDEPTDADLVIPNHGGVSPADSAERILAFLDQADLSAWTDHDRREYWRRFYARDDAPSDPSSFARVVAEEIGPPARLLEVGCGNGRDASLFASLGFEVVAVDVSEGAIEAAVKAHGDEGIAFVPGDIAGLPADQQPFEVVYSRFSLHAMTPLEEDVFLDESAARLRPGGRLFVECRSINDPLARKGEVISRTERVHGHYRRFVVADELRAKVEARDLEIDSLDEAQGLARLGDDDPVVIRLSATRGE
jgi:adenylylsulfate kinase-like enzyme/2-polyprenyl-3-methyl-5-hydroxy-6-metoxy-1,4-benzoquinol methylase